MAYEDGNGDLGIILNTELMILKGVVQGGAYLGRKLTASKLNPLVLLQYFTKLKLDKRISESDFRSFKEFLKASEGDYTIASLPTQDADKIENFCDSLYEAGITYYVLPDLDMSDGSRQIAILNRDIGKWQGIYESFVSAELTQGGVMSFQELKAVTSGQYQIKGISIGDYRADDSKLTALLRILSERHVNYAVLPDLKYGDYNLQLAIANVDLNKFQSAMQVFIETFASEKEKEPGFGEAMNLTNAEYLQTGNMSEQQYMDTAEPDLQREMKSEKWKKKGDIKSDSFEAALAPEAETLLPGQYYITINESLVMSQENDMIFSRIPRTKHYFFLGQTQTLDDGRTYAAILDGAKEYPVYELNDKNLPHRIGVFTGEEIYTHYDPVTRNIPAAEHKEVQQGQTIPETVTQTITKPDYFEDAGYYVIERGKASAGMLQRQFKIGYQTASELMDRLSDAGVISRAKNSAPSNVLMTKDQFEQHLRSIPKKNEKQVKTPQMGNKGGLRL